MRNYFSFGLVVFIAVISNGSSLNAQCNSVFTFIQQDICTSDTNLLGLPGVDCTTDSCPAQATFVCAALDSFGTTGELVVGTSNQSHDNSIFCGGNSCRSITNIYVEVSLSEVDYLGINFGIFLRNQYIATIAEPSGNLDLNLPRPDAYPVGPLVDFYYSAFRDAYTSTWAFNSNSWNGQDPYGINWNLQFQEYGGDGDIILNYKIQIEYEACVGTQPATAIATDSFLAGNGCDSIVITSTTYHPVVNDTVQRTICSSDSAFAGGAFQNQTGIYNDTLVSLSGCDSIVFTDLTVIPDSTCTICNADFAYFVNSNSVALSNISTNSTSYFWDFGDGANSTQQNPTHTYSQNGSYLVCLTAYNLNGCSDIACYSILISGVAQQYFCLSGKVMSGVITNAAFPATLYLIYNDTALGTLTAIRTTTANQTGSYQFCNVPLGRYLLKAALDSAAINFTSFLPTYYGNALFWSNAQEILLTSNTTQADILLIAGSNPGGPGFIGGYVNQGANKMAGPGDPIANVQVMLLDMADNPLQYIHSDATGRWEFSNVAYGVYKVYAEVLGVPTFPHIVTIGAQSETVDNIEIQIETSQVISGILPFNAIVQSLSVYPNPTNSDLHLDISLARETDLNILLTDIAGKTLLKETFYGVAGEHKLRLDLSQQQSGLYFMHLSGRNDFMTHKIVKY